MDERGYRQNRPDREREEREREGYGGGYDGPQGRGYDGPQGRGYDAPRGGDYDGPRGGSYDGPQGRGYDGPQGRGYDGPQGRDFDGPRSGGYDGPQGRGYDGPQGRGYDGPRGGDHDGPRRGGYDEPREGGYGAPSPYGGPPQHGGYGVPQPHGRGYEQRTEEIGGYNRGERVNESETGYNPRSGKAFTETQMHNKPYGSTGVIDKEKQRLENLEDARGDEERNDNIGDIGTVAALGAGAVALWARHQQEADPENAARHKTEERIAEAALVGGIGTAIYGHHQENEAEERIEQYEKRDEKKKGWFG